MLKFFNKLFKKKEPILTIEYIKKNDDFIENCVEDLIEKWTPNDELYRRYNHFIDTLGDINSNKYKLKKDLKLKLEIEERIKELKETEKDIFDEVKRLDYEIELENIKIRITKYEKKLEYLKNMDNQILQEWKEYTRSAKEFIKRNSLEQFIEINNILSSDNIFITLKKQFDGAVVSKNNEKYIETFSKLSLYFDIRKTRGNMKLNYYKNEEIMNKRKELIKKLDNEAIFSLDYTEQQRKGINEQLNKSLFIECSFTC